MYKLFMEFENPTEEFLGKYQSTQGFAVHGETGFVLFHSGLCAAFNLKTKERKPLGVFKLGSFDLGETDKRYANHANDAMFGNTVEGENFPLMYVTAGNSGEMDEKGYISYCAVEQIRLRDGVYSAETVQRIYYKNDGIEATSFRAIGWGWPAALVDVENGHFYTLSARNRTLRQFAGDDNAYIITKFRLPDVSEGDITFTAKDILDQFELPFNVFATQGGTIKYGKIWYTFGFGKEDYPDALRVIDLKKKEYALCEDLSDTPFYNDEIECCAFYQGNRFLVNTQSGKIYERIV